MKINTTLTSLDLRSDDIIMITIKKWNTNPIKQWTDNRIGDEGAIQISESLKSNATLTELDLGSDDKI